ncbi:hypothetical protein [Singulisphaera sp. PoT]|uniref:hypothetical protein n=1 Tax=Singulisphaera sp. PoT TaxID=3411797 RepID=UPI003BF5C409
MNNAKTDRLIQLLKAGDPAFCGEAPLWIREILLERLIPPTGPDRDEEAFLEEFRGGAVRYITDCCGVECETLLENLRALILGA